jgi:predicted cation transporter
LNLSFVGLFALLGPCLIPGVMAVALAARFAARAQYANAEESYTHAVTARQTIVQEAKLFAFVAGWC